MDENGPVPNAKRGDTSPLALRGIATAAVDLRAIAPAASGGFRRVELFVRVFSGEPSAATGAADEVEHLETRVAFEAPHIGTNVAAMGTTL